VVDEMNGGHIMSDGIIYLFFILLFINLLQFIEHVS